MTHSPKVENNNGWCKKHLDAAVERLVEQAKADDKYRQINCYEFGVDEGLSIQYLKRLLASRGIRYNSIYGFDSFEGLPDEAKGIDKFYLFKKGFFDRGGEVPYLHDVNLIKGWFSELNADSVRRYTMKPAAIIHIDCDLYISAKDALRFMFDNRLITTDTVLTYDEFKSTEPLFAGGEALAHKEVCDLYKVECEEIYRNEYMDRISCWQNTFIIKSIGQKVDYGINYAN